MRRFWFKLSAAVAGLAVAVWAAVWFFGANSRTVMLPRGVRLSLVAVTQGATNACFPGGPLDKLFQRLFPGKSVSIGKLKFAPILPLTDIAYSAVTGREASPNQAIVWLRDELGGLSNGRHSVSRDQWHQDFRAAIADEAGEEWEMRPGQNHAFSLGGTKEISAWHFPSYPRRGEYIRFKLYRQGVSNQWDLIADIKTTNPARGPYPLWKERALPFTVTNRDLSVSPVKLVSGSKIVHYYPGKRAFTKATFRVQQNGRQTTNWIPQWMDATDATGNEGAFQVIDMGETNGLVFYDAQAGSLSPSEVWRLKMKFKQVGGFSDDRVWTSPNLVVHNGLLQDTNVTGSFPGYSPTIHLSCYGGFIMVKLDKLPEGWELSLVGMVDDRNIGVGRLPGGFAEDNAFQTLPKIDPEARSIRVQIAPSRLRFFEFLARPTLE